MHARTWSMSLGLGRFTDWMRLVVMVLNACFSNASHTRHRHHKTENFGIAGIMSENKRGIHLGWRRCSGEAALYEDGVNQTTHCVSDIAPNIAFAFLLDKIGVLALQRRFDRCRCPARDDHLSSALVARREDGKGRGRERMR